jgi:hypothetical protein
MSSSAELTTQTPALDARRAEPAPVAAEADADVVGGALGAYLGGAPPEPPVAATARLVNHPVMARPANRAVRALALRRAQQTYGNHFVQRVVQRQCACGGTCDRCRAADEMAPAASVPAEEEPRRAVQARPADGGLSAGADVLPADSAARPLDPGTRRFMESRFGRDLNDVRVHSDGPAAESATALGADAYTSGRDVYFAAGKYAPDTAEGQHLLAHELAHTVQQADGRMPEAVAARGSDGVIVGSPDDPMEAEAERAADAVAGAGARGPVAVSADHVPVVRRQEAPAPEAKKDEGVLDFLGRKAGEAVEAVEGWAIEKIEKYAPGLLKLLRGNVVEYLKDKIAAGLDGVFGGLVARVEKDGLVGALEGMVGDLVGGVTKSVTHLASDACAGLAKAAQAVFDFARWIGGTAFDALKKGAAAVGGFFSEIWDDLGAPAWKAIKSFASATWDWIEAQAKWIWDKTAPVRDAFARAWAWLKRQFNVAWDSGAGVLDWLKEKASAAWDKIKGVIQPVMGPLKVIGGVLALLSPLGPVILIWKAAPVVWDGLKWLAANWGKLDIVVTARDVLKDHVLPAIISGVSHLSGLLGSAAAWLAEKTASLTGALKALADALGVSALLNLARKAVTWLSEQATRLATWATTGFVKVVEAVRAALQKVWEYARPVLEVLVKVSIVLLNPELLPIVLTGWGWRALPDCLKPPIIDFLLDVLIAAVRAIPNLSFFGEAWPQTKAKVLATLGEVRTMGLPGKIAASNRVARILSGEDMSWIGDLLKAAMQVPEHLEGQFEEELIGMNLTEPLPFERTQAPSPEATAAAAVESGALPPENAPVLNRAVFGEGDVGVDHVATGELDPALVDSINPGEGGSVEFGESNDPARSMEAVKAELLGQEATPPAPAGAEARAAPPGPAAAPEAAAPAAPEKTTEERLQELMDQPAPQVCGKAKEGEPAKAADVPEHLKFGPLTRGQRASYLLNQMGKGVKSWFSCNAKWLVPTLIGVFAALVALEILTGGAVTAALPPLMEIIGTIMIGVAMVRVAAYVAEYLAKGIAKDVAGAAKSLARGLAVGAIELVFALMFNLGDVIKVLKGEIKLSVQGAVKAAKTAVRTTVESVEELGRIGVRGLKTAGANVAKFGRALVRNGKILLEGVGEGIGRGVKTLGELAERLWNKVRFRKFRLRFGGGWFRLEGFINPWVVIMEGPLRGQIREITQEGTKGAKVGGEGVFRLAEGGEQVTGKVVTLGKDLTPKYREIFELFHGVPTDKFVIHHLIERQAAKLTDAVTEALLHSPLNLRPIPKGLYNNIVHLSEIRKMWNTAYPLIRDLPEKAVITALTHYASYTDDFLAHMLAEYGRLGKNATGEALSEAAAAWIKAHNPGEAAQRAIAAARQVK